MNALKVLAFVSLSCLLCGCKDKAAEPQLATSFVHKYGVQISSEEWKDRGQNGKIVQALDGGIKVSTTYQRGILNGARSTSFPHSEVIAELEIFDQGKLVSHTWNNKKGFPETRKTYLNVYRMVCQSWYDDGSPKFSETYDHGKLFSGEYFDENNKKESTISEGDGERILRTPQGMLTAKEKFTNGLITERQTFLANGEPESVIEYVDGIVQGKKHFFLPGGVPSREESWFQGEQHGVTIVFENGLKIVEQTYVHNKLEGEERHYRDGEVLVESISWRNNLKHGPSNSYLNGKAVTTWYYNGARVSKTHFEQLDGSIV